MSFSSCKIPVGWLQKALSMLIVIAPGYESEFTRIHSYVQHLDPDPGPLVLGFTSGLEFNTTKC